jgi:hypothetical protein
MASRTELSIQELGVADASNPNVASGRPLTNNAIEHFAIYAAVQRDMPLFSALHAILLGQVDRSIPQAENEGLMFLQTMLGHSLEGFESAHPGTPEEAYQGMLKTAVEVLLKSKTLALIAVLMQLPGGFSTTTRGC